MPYASRSDRLFGQILDGLIAIGPALGLFVVPLLGEMLIGVYTVAWFGWMLFHILLADGLVGGQSLGKRVARIKVVDAASGAPCSFGQSFVRNICLSFLGPIDWVFIFGERHQRLGDKLAGTVVLSAA